MTEPIYRPEDHAQVEQQGTFTRVSFGSPEAREQAAVSNSLAAAGDAAIGERKQMSHQTYHDVVRPDDVVLATARTPDGAPSIKFEDRDTVVVEGISMQIRSAIQYGFLRRTATGELTSGK